MTEPFLIALDWGSTRFRGWLLDPKGIEIDKIDEEFGILKINHTQYIDVFDQLLGSWIKEHGSMGAHCPNYHRDRGILCLV